AAACAGAAALPQPWLPPPLGVFANIAAGGVGFVVVLWWFELRGRLRKVGDGLATASGFVE
ncbi:MAG: hypothetical protein H6835_21260, partial [Planctomycetes bacterium]|nr:hypothetical protein [Planctomycetota bacterium]